MLRKLTVSLLMLALVLVGCEKEKRINNQSKPNGHKPKNESIQYVLDNVPIIANPHDVSLYTTNEKDADDEKINLQLLDIAIATRNLLKETPQNQNVLKRAKVSAISSINLLDFISNSNLKSARQSTAYTNLVSLLEKADLTHASTNPMNSGEIEAYVPAIYVPNAENADLSKQPIVGVGFQVKSDIPGMEKFEDYIVAWYYDPDGNLHEILLNEETAMNTTNPVFIINNAEKKAIDRKKSAIAYQSKEVPSSNRKSGQSRTVFSSHEYQINKRYERWGKSEFCITAAHINPNGNAYNILIRDNRYGYHDWKKIANVKKKHIGKLRKHWEQFISTDVTPHWMNYTYWNTYERDWYSSPKDLGQGSGNGKTVFLSGNRKYSSEWYAYFPGVVKYNPVDYNTIYWNWSKWHNNSLGKFRLWRVQL